MILRAKNISRIAVEVLSARSWWMKLVYALFSFTVLHWLTTLDMAFTPGENLFSRDASQYFLHRLVFWAQFVIPVALLAAALVSARKSINRKKLYDKIARNVFHHSFDDLSRRDFTFLVGEYFRHRGFSVEKAIGAGGSVDLIAVKDKEKYCIWCRRGEDEIEAGTIRKLLDSMAETDVTGGIIVATGRFSQEAKSLAKADTVLLLDGRELHGAMRLETMERTVPHEWMSSKKLLLSCSLVVVAICLSVVNFAESGASFYALLSARLQHFFLHGGSHQDTKDAWTDKPQEESKDLHFTDDQVKQAMNEVLNIKRRQQFDILTKDQRTEDGGYLYEIELVTGGWIYPVNARITETHITYQSGNGTLVSLDRAEVKSIRRRKIAP